MEIHLLGPVELLVAGRSEALGGSRQRALLAALAVDAGRTVSVDVLIDRVWGENAPAAARHGVHSYVSRLRKLLPAGEAGLTREHGGYQLDVAADRVDLRRFRAAIARAWATSGAAQAGPLREALDLWRGEPLDGIDGDWATGVRESLTRARVAAAVAWADLATMRGDAPAAVGELQELTGAAPLDESLGAALMRALHAAGRSAEALDRYAALRERLAQELGCDPGAALRRLHVEILRDGDTAPAPKPEKQAGTAPSQLPADISGFTGRSAELAAMDALLGERGENGEAATLVIAAVAGSAGVGKTALAIRWAHRNRDRFPDGQLYVNLRGYDDEHPVTATDALAGFLAALGVPAQEIPVEPEQRAARFRTAMHRRRTLVVLDNAATVGQVRPLLPGAPGSLVLVTSRDSLAGLVARDGARRLHLDLLPPDDAVALLGRLIGDRADDDPENTGALAHLCARLPLALRIAAELAVARPGDSLAALVGELSDQRQRIERLDAGGDPYSAVRAVFSWSLRALTPGAARVFALLGLHPGPDADRYAVAALAGDDPAAMARFLDELARAHLAQRVTSARYTMHDLLRAYAVSLLDPDEAAAARTRSQAYYLAASSAAARLLHPRDAADRAPAPDPPTPLPDLSSADAARAWLDTELPTLIALSTDAAGNDPPGYAVALSDTLHRHLEYAHPAEAIVVHRNGWAAARAAGDLEAQGRIAVLLGIAYRTLGRIEDGIRQAEAAIELLGQAGDLVGQARATTQLGAFEMLRCNYRVAADLNRQALELFRAAGFPTGEAGALTNLGLVLRRLGELQESVDAQQAARALFRTVGDPVGEAIARHNLGRSLAMMGRHEEALAEQQQALPVFADRGHQHGLAMALDSIGEAYLRLGDPVRATEYMYAALKLAEEINSSLSQALVRNSLGAAATVAGDHAGAIEHHHAALDLAQSAGAREEEARAHMLLAEVHRATGDLPRADQHEGAALDLNPYANRV